ncbi:MAG: 3-deoxy-8-phosphooctulonate synthase [Gammaproteobacteria bacterium]|nr:3-deoxy-8-phosphooctulonate synthase [Gammaproteobacteria bacterium]
MQLGNYQVGLNQPLLLIAGPCVIESEKLVLETAATLKEICSKLKMPLVFKSSFDKANRTSLNSFRGPGLEAGLRILQRVRDELELPILTDVHEYTPLSEVAEVVDVLQIPAFLSRQTDFIVNVASMGKVVNIKKGQFLSPADMVHVVAKARSSGNQAIMVCDRGTSFGYHTLISDMRGLEIMRETGAPVIFDATHSVQQPGGLNGKSGGERRFVPLLARAAVAAGVSGVFIETHPNPDNALSDGPNMLPLASLEALLSQLQAVDACVKPLD